MAPPMNRVWRPVLGFLALLLGGCATETAPPNPAPRVLLVLQIAGGGAPTPQQAAQVQQAIRPILTQVGFQLAERVGLADYVLSATFAPDPVDPAAGRLTLRSFEPARRDRGDRANPAAGTLREMQSRVENLERWALRSQIGR